MGRPVDKTVEVPFYFTKSPSTLVESGETIPYPPQTNDYQHEMELVLAIGAPGFRVGQGFDIHRFGDDPARPLVLGGCVFDGVPGLQGHSDADAIAHAATDALLGAAGLGDIGEHFPDDDERWHDADSLELLRTVAAQVQASGASLRHIDVTVLVEAPKLAPHREQIRGNLSAVLGLGLPHVNVKATRGEGMGFVGRGEGAAALAVATVERT